MFENVKHPLNNKLIPHEFPNLPRTSWAVQHDEIRNALAASHMKYVFYIQNTKKTSLGKTEVQFLKNKAPARIARQHNQSGKSLPSQ